MPSTDPLVKIRDLHLSLGGNQVLRGLSLDVQRGQAISIIGPSGSGKSTILRCIGGLLAPASGQIEVCGLAVQSLHSEQQKIDLRKRLGFVFQQYNLFPHLSVLDNLLLAPQHVLGLSREQAEPLARELLKKVHMEHKIDHYPGELSGGQQQRVAIARALAMQPELVLFDEVTSALDPEMVAEVLSVIRELIGDGLTCVLVTHEMRFAEDISDQVHFTDGGVIVEHAPPAQLFHSPQHPRTREFLAHARH